MTSSPSPLRRFLSRTAIPEIYVEIRDYFANASGKTLVGLILCPILITLTIRIGTLPTARDVLAYFTRTPLDPLYHWGTIFIFQFLVLYVIPVLCIKVGFRESLSEFGHRLRPLFRLWPLMLLFVAVMLPITYTSSLRPVFRTYYPLYRGSLEGWPSFLLFEAGIFLAFFTQEFFFRGFLIEVLKPKFGLNAIPIASAMYGIAHYTKPLPEQLGAFFVGLVLGYIGDKYRTFYFGVIVHYLIALSMDAWIVVPELLRR